MLITRELLRTWDACYSDEKIAELVPVEGLSPLAVCDLQTVPAADRLWVLLREEIIPARELRLLACDWAERALTMVGNVAPCYAYVIAVARRHADGDASDVALAASAADAVSLSWASLSSVAAATAAKDTARQGARLAAVWASATAAETAWLHESPTALDPVYESSRTAVHKQQLSDVRRILTT